MRMIRLLLLTLTLAAVLAVPARAEPMADLRAGNASFRDGKYDEAVQAYTRAIISGQLGAEALAVTFNNRGVAYGELGDFDRAIIDYNEALGLRPDDPTSIRNLRVGHVKRGVAEANLGESEKAAADFTKAIELDPSHFLAYMRRGQLRSDRGELDLAIADLEKAQNLAPDNTQAVELLTKARQMRADSQAPAVNTAVIDPGAGPPAASPPSVSSPPAVSPPSAMSPRPSISPPAAISPPTVAAVPRAPAPVAPAPPAVAASEPTPSVATAQPRQTSPAPEAATAPPQRQQRAVARAEPVGEGQRMRLRQSVSLRGGPGNEFERITTMPGGSVATIRGQKQGWYELEFSSGRRGWIYERFLEPAAE